MGYIFNEKDAVAYDEWFGSFAKKPEGTCFTNLVYSLLQPEKYARIIDIGCGPGHMLQDMIASKKISATGVDPSPSMINIAANKLHHTADLHKASAEDLPFEDNSFNYACLVNTLEFTENPAKAIEEAARVASDRLFICIHSRYGANGFEQQCKPVLSEAAWHNMQFFSFWEIKHLIKTIIGNVPIHWKSVSRLSSETGYLASRIDKIKLIQKIPFGFYTGFVVDLVPTYRTRPLILHYLNNKKNQLTGAEEFNPTAGSSRKSKNNGSFPL